MKAPDAVDIPVLNARSWTLVDLMVLLFVCLLAVALRCFELERPGIWFDESSSCRWIEFPLSELFQRTAADCHPPFYWILLKGWSVLFGNSIGVLRSMSSLFGVATVLAAYALVHDLPLLAESNRHWSVSSFRFAAGLAAVLIAISPFHVEWSQEMRMYSLGTFEVLISTWLLVRGLSPGSPQRVIWCGYSLVGLCLVYTLYFSLFTLLAHGVYVVGRGMFTGRWSGGYFTAIAVIALGWIPWLPSLWSMFRTVQTSFPQGPLTWPEFRELFWQMFVPQSHSWNNDYAKILLIEISVAVIILLIFRPQQGSVLIGLCAFIPIYAIVNISLFSQSLIARHRLILAQIFILLGWSLVVQRIRFNVLRWILAGLSVLASCAATSNYLQYRETKASLPGLRAAMKAIDRQRAADDFVVFVNPMLYLNGIRYTSNVQHVRAIGDQSRYPYYQGSSLTRETDYVNLIDLPSSARTVFVVEAKNWLGGTWTVPMSFEWDLVNEDHFPEFYGEIIVKQYHRSPAKNSTGL